MDKAVVFISHISEEQGIAQALKKLVEESFLGLIEVFVSSDANSIKLGHKWLDNITTALKNCKIEIIIASPTSVKRPWVNFEAGAGWVRNIPVIPLCHSGMTPLTLPTPLKELQAALATDKESLANLTPVLAEAINSKLPEIDWSGFISMVSLHELTYAEETEQIKEMEEKSPLLPTHGLLPHELTTLLLIGENVAGTDDGHSIWELLKGMESTGYTNIAAGLAIKSLTRKNLIIPCMIESQYLSNDGPMPGAKLTDEGWAWLDENKLQLSLIRKTPKPSSTPTIESSNGDEVPF